MQSAGEMISQVTRNLQEVEMLLEHMGQHIRDTGDHAKAEKFFAKAVEVGRRASHFQEIAVEHESLSTDNVEQKQRADD